MASVIKRRVIESLAEWLVALVAPDIPAGDVIIQDAGADAHACFPNLVVRHIGAYEFQAFEEDEIWTTDDTDPDNPNTRAVQVGDLSGQIEIILGATNEPFRERMEDRILHALLKETSQEGFGRPGVLVLQLDNFTVGGIANMADVPVGYVLQTETWQEEMVFEKKRYSTLTLDIDMPALVVRQGMYDIDELVLAITDDLTSTDPALSDIQVAVSEDGDLTEYTDPP